MSKTLNLSENPQYRLNRLHQKFPEIATVNKAREFIRVEPFNYTIGAAELEDVAMIWAYLFQDKEIDAIVGLPYAGLRLMAVPGLLLGATLLPATREDGAAQRYGRRVGYRNESYTRRREVQSYIGEAQPGMKVLVVDDVIAYGETMNAAILSLMQAGLDVVGACAVFEKVWQGGSEKIARETGITPFSVISVESITEDDTLILRPPHQIPDRPETVIAK